MISRSNNAIMHISVWLCLIEDWRQNTYQQQPSCNSALRFCTRNVVRRKSIVFHPKNKYIRILYRFIERRSVWAVFKMMAILWISIMLPRPSIPSIHRWISHRKVSVIAPGMCLVIAGKTPITCGQRHICHPPLIKRTAGGFKPRIRYEGVKIWRGDRESWAQALTDL